MKTNLLRQKADRWLRSGRQEKTRGRITGSGRKVLRAMDKFIFLIVVTGSYVYTLCQNSSYCPFIECQLSISTMEREQLQDCKLSAAQRLKLGVMRGARSRMLSSVFVRTNQVPARRPGSLRPADPTGRHGAMGSLKKRVAGLPEAFQNSVAFYPERTEAPWKDSRQVSDLNWRSF